MAEKNDGRSQKLPKLPSENTTNPSRSSTSRLLSFRTPRDLTLGLSLRNSLTSNTKPKKTFTPNIPAKREKITEKVDQNNPVEKRASKRASRIENHIKREKVEFIQTPGAIFGDGIDATQRPHISKSSSRKESEPMLPPKYEPGKITDKKIEREKLDELLNCNFIEDIPESEDHPIHLPMQALRLPSDSIPKHKIKEEVKDTNPFSNGYDEIFDVKPKITHHENSFLEIFDDSSRNNFILFQFPDCLPTLGVADENDADSKAQGQTACNLKNLPDGKFGTLKIFKSGKAKIVMENGYSFDVNVGSKPSCLENLVTLKLNSEKTSGDLTVLKQVDQKIICTPDWSQLMS